MTARVRAIATAAALVLVGLTVDVVLGGPATRADGAVERFVRRHQAPALRTVLDAVTVVLSPPVTVTVLVLVALLSAYLRRAVEPLLQLVLALAGLVLLVVAVKAAVGRPGPEGRPAAGSHGYFPSGHTSSAVVAFGTAALLLAPPGSAVRRGALAAVAATGLLVSASLVYCSYHWVSDVVAGSAVGVLVLALQVLVESRAGRSWRPGGHRVSWLTRLMTVARITAPNR